MLCPSSLLHLSVSNSRLEREAIERKARIQQITNNVQACLERAESVLSPDTNFSLPLQLTKGSDEDRLMNQHRLNISYLISSLRFDERSKMLSELTSFIESDHSFLPKTEIRTLQTHRSQLSETLNKDNSPQTLPTTNHKDMSTNKSLNSSSSSQLLLSNSTQTSSTSLGRQTVSRKAVESDNAGEEYPLRAQELLLEEKRKLDSEMTKSLSDVTMETGQAWEKWVALQQQLKGLCCFLNTYIQIFYCFLLLFDLPSFIKHSHVSEKLSLLLCLPILLLLHFLEVFLLPVELLREPRTHPSKLFERGVKLRNLKERNGWKPLRRRLLL